jgi:hypothetical protein
MHEFIDYARSITLKNKFVKLGLELGYGNFSDFGAFLTH